MGEYLSGVVREIREGSIVIAYGSGSAAKSHEIPFFSATEFRMPAESEGKRTTRAAQLKEIETGQTVSVRMSTAERAKAKLITVTRLAKQPNPSPSPRVNERRASPSRN
jgi:hypothetical protein